MPYLPTYVEICRKETIIAFSRKLQFIIEKLQFQMQEEGVDQENSRTPRWKRWKQNF
jgi:hypothetical protein